MAGLKFDITVNLEKLVKLKEEIDRVKNSLDKMNQSGDRKAVDKLVKELNGLQKSYDKTAESVQKAANKIRSSGKDFQVAEHDIERFTNAIYKLGGAALSLNALKNFASQVVSVRGEIQQLEIAFETMLNSKSKADSMMSDIKELALKTPFTLTEVADNTKQLIAMGIEADKVIDTMKALGDVAAGVSVPISRIAVNYGQVAALGRLQSREIRDFAMAGIPVVDELSKMLGKTSAEISEMVEAGKIGFPLVEQAFKNMSSEGGRFYNLMEKQNASVTGQISKLQDELQMMFNSIGQANQGIIYDAVGVASNLVANYEKIGRIMAGLIATYGTYKAAVIIATTAEQGWTIAQLANYKALLLVEKAQKLLNATMLKNPYVLAATVLVGLVASMWALSESTNAAEKAQAAYNKRKEDVLQQEQDHKRKIDELISKINEATTAELDRIGALDELKRAYPGIIEKYIDEKGHLRDLIALKKELADLDAHQKIQADSGELDQLMKLSEKIDQARDKKGGFTPIQLTKDELDLLDSMGYERGTSVEKYLAEAIKLKQQDVKNNAVAEWKTTLKDLTDEQANTAIEQRQRLISILKNNGGEKVNLSDMGIDFDFSESELQDQIKSLTDTLNSRNQSVVKNEEFWKKELEGAKAAFTAIDEAEKGSEKWNKALERVNNAREKLKIWDTSRKSSNDSNKSKSGIADRLAAIQEAQKKIKQQEYQNELDLQQQQISLMDEGSAKVHAQIELDYEKRLADIARNGDEMIKAQQDIERKIWEVQNPKWKEKGMTFTPTTTSVGQLPASQQKYLEDNAFLAEEARKKSIKEQIESEKQAMNEYLKEYGKYQEKILATTEIYSKKITDAKTEGERKSLEKEMEKELKAIHQEFAGKSNLFTDLFSNASKMSRKRIDEIIKNTKRLLDYINGVEGVEIPVGFSEEQIKALKEDPEKLKAIYDALIQKQEEYDNKTNYPFSNIIKGFNRLKESAEETKKAIKETDKAKKKLFEDKADASKQEGLDYLLDGALQAAEGLSEISGMISEVADVTGDQRLKDFTETLNDWSDILTKTASGAKSGGIWGAIGGLVSGVGTSVFNGYIKEQERIRQMQNEQLEWAQRYNLLLMERNYLEEEYSSFFGKRGIEQAIKAYESYNKTVNSYYDSVNEKLDLDLYNTKKYQGFFLNNTVRSNARKVLQDAMDRDMSVLQGSLIQIAEHEWYKFGSKDRFKTLFDFAPEIWGGDINGEFDAEAARLFLETHKDISDELRTQLELSIEQKDAYDAAMKVLDDHIESTFGNIATDLTDIIFEAVRNGSDAWDLFEKAGLKVVDALGKALLQEMILGEYLEQFRPKIREAFGLGDPAAVQNELLAITTEIFDGIPTAIDAWTAVAENWDKMATDMGWDMSLLNTDSNASENTLKGAYAKASQESIDLLAGQTGAARVALESIKEILERTLGTMFDISVFNPVFENIQLMKDAQVAGWRDVSLIREIVGRMETMSGEIRDTNYRIATSNDNIAVSVGKSAASIQAIESGGVKMKGAGLGL
ncbi:MAG: tape measure protein [Tannerella sp.]|jgi:tape measure domain-containing protein|nr:tape measure protein [Tannerella sp.]